MWILFSWLKVLRVKGDQQYFAYFYKKKIFSGKRGKLMSSSLASHPHLSRFLQGGENRFMAWLHDIHANDYFEVLKTSVVLDN